MWLPFVALVCDARSCVCAQVIDRWKPAYAEKLQLWWAAGGGQHASSTRQAASVHEAAAAAKRRELEEALTKIESKQQARCMLAEFFVHGSMWALCCGITPRTCDGANACVRATAGCTVDARR